MNTKSNYSTNKLSSPLIVFLLAFIACFLWGSAIPMIKKGYEAASIISSDTWSQILFAGIRFTIAGFMVLILGSFFSNESMLPSKKSFKYAAILSIFQTTGQYFFFYIAVAHTAGVTGSILLATGTFFTILIACLIFRHEKLTAKKLLGCVVGFLGVVTINLSGSGLTFNFTLLGEGFIIISTIMSATSSSLIKGFSKNEDPVKLSGYQFIIGGIVLMLIGFIMGGKIETINLKTVIILLYLALVSAVAYSLWSLLLKYNPVSRVAIYSFINPVCGVFLSAIILNEYDQALRIQSLIALILVSLGIFICNFVKKKS